MSWFNKPEPLTQPAPVPITAEQVAEQVAAALNQFAQKLEEQKQMEPIKVALPEGSLEKALLVYVRWQLETKGDSTITWRQLRDLFEYGVIHTVLPTAAAPASLPHGAQVPVEPGLISREIGFGGPQDPAFGAGKK